MKGLVLTALVLFSAAAAAAEDPSPPFTVPPLDVPSLRQLPFVSVETAALNRTLGATLWARPAPRLVSHMPVVRPIPTGDEAMAIRPADTGIRYALIIKRPDLAVGK